MIVTLKDGSKKEYSEAMSVIDIAKISVKDLRETPVQEKLMAKSLI